MRQESYDLKFEAIDSTSETNNPVNSTLALVNDSGLPDEVVRDKVTSSLEEVAIDFHSGDLDAPRELPALYERMGDGREGYHCSIYAPRDGKIKSVRVKDSSTGETRDTGRNGLWETFTTEDTNYSVIVE